MELGRSRTSSGLSARFRIEPSSAGRQIPRKFCIAMRAGYYVRVFRVAYLHVWRVASCVVFPIGIGSRRGLHCMAGRAGVRGGDGDYLPIVGVGFLRRLQ
jgi:hypothetical protein